MRQNLIRTESEGPQRIELRNDSDDFAVPDHGIGLDVIHSEQPVQVADGRLWRDLPARPGHYIASGLFKKLIHGSLPGGRRRAADQHGTSRIGSGCALDLDLLRDLGCRLLNRHLQDSLGYLGRDVFRLHARR